jgi:hypothetical protein
MSGTFMLLVGGAAFAVLRFGRLVRSQVLRHLAGPVAFLGLAALAQWLVLTLGSAGYGSSGRTSRSSSPSATIAQ